jgi:hypothetical protein
MGLSGSDCVPWSDSLEDPIPGMTTLRDPASYIQKLPKAEQRLPHWQTAAEMLIHAAVTGDVWLIWRGSPRCGR